MVSGSVSPPAAHKSLAILISGSGTNLQALIDTCRSGELPAQIALVISNRPQARGLQRARQAGLRTCVIDHTTFNERADFEQALITAIDDAKVDAVVLAGFMRVLTPIFVTRYQGRLLNIHPSLLPRYPGLHTHQRALENGDAEAGATVHFVVPELDAGPAIVQARVPVLANDTVETLSQRVLQQEHRIYPLAIRWLVEGRLRLTSDGVILDGQPVPVTGIPFTEPSC